MGTTVFGLIVLSFAVGCGEPREARSEVEGDTPAPVADFSDPVARDARRAIDEGYPWRARRMLDSVLRDPSRRNPEVLLVAAHASAAVEEWERVERFLADAPWLDSLAHGDGWILLTRSAFERSADSLAAERAGRAMALASTDRQRGERSVLLARALDRLSLRDSARVAYLDGARQLPEVADWLRLRAAGVTWDSTSRHGLLQEVRLPVAVARVPLTDAITRERSGDVAGAIRRYDELGARPTVLRLRLALAGGDPIARDSLRRALVALVRSRSGTAEARQAVEVLDLTGPVSSAEELVVARSLSRSGPLARAATGYAKALAGDIGTAADRLDYGIVLSRLGRDREAAAQFAMIRSPADVAAAASYQRGRSLIRVGDLERGRAELRRTGRDYPSDTSNARSMLLLSDLAADEARDGAARATYRDVVARFPRSEMAAVARFRAALIAYIDGAYRTAALELDTMRATHPESAEMLAAGYWSGRAWAHLGDSASARERWRSVIQRSPLSYYSAVSARRLGEQPWAPARDSAAAPRFADVDSVFRRVALLERLGMGFEAGLEYERLDQQAGESVERALAVGSAYLNAGMAWRAARVANRALGRGGSPDARLYRLAYPRPHGELLRVEGASKSLDLALVAALIRQESGFNPRATSGAGARGLMQIMPAVGQQIARGMQIPDWNPGLLYQPEVSLALGTRHLAAALGRYDDLARALAAYNAGGSRVTRWDRKAGTHDPEMFIERISFVETRDYVRIVLRNRDLYRALYEW